MAMKAITKAGAKRRIFEAKLFISGRRGRWEVFSRMRSKTRMRAGRTVTQPMTPKMTPLAMTRPRSKPRVKVMNMRAMKPAMVVILEPTTEENVCLMAVAMAFSLSLVDCCCSL